MADTGKKMILIILGLVTIFMGVAPFLATSGSMPSALSFIPVAGTTYNIVIIILGGLVILTSSKIY